mmetsp:Transcript_3026/g.4977  ORF Transcript_3026/g.4977 Transcript_3026/m.4977 type:complete len:97 (+) Transcript_3026:241-531(+)
MHTYPPYKEQPTDEAFQSNGVMFGAIRPSFTFSSHTRSPIVQREEIETILVCDQKPKAVQCATKQKRPAGAGAPGSAQPNKKAPPGAGARGGRTWW